MPATQSESSTPVPAPAEPRYPKRKRAEVQYNYQDGESAEDDSESELIPVKRPRNTKPLPKRKIFPFLSLPAELRNRIYEELVPPSTKVPEGLDCDPEGVWLCFKQHFYRRTVGYIPWVDQDDLEQLESGNGFVASAREARRRFLAEYNQNRAGGDNGDNHSEPESEENEDAPTAFGCNILSVCKQIYDEAAPMIYAKTLVFTDVDALFAFAASLSPRTAKLLRSIEIRSWSNTRSRKSRGYNAMAMLAAKGVTNLTSLHINCAMDYFHTYSWRNNRKETPVPKRVARKVYRDCHLWLEAMGSHDGDIYRGTKVLKISATMFSHGNHWDDVTEEERNAYNKELCRLLRARAL